MCFYTVTFHDIDPYRLDVRPQEGLIKLKKMS